MIDDDDEKQEDLLENFNKLFKKIPNNKDKEALKVFILFNNKGGTSSNEKNWINRFPKYPLVHRGGSWKTFTWTRARNAGKRIQWKKITQ